MLNFIPIIDLNKIKGLCLKKQYLGPPGSLLKKICITFVFKKIRHLSSLVDKGALRQGARLCIRISIDLTWATTFSPEIQLGRR